MQMIFLVLTFPFYFFGQERVSSLENLIPGSTVDLPADFKFENFNLQKRLAIHKFIDRESESSCSMFLTGSESTVQMSRATSWIVSELVPSQASNESCRRDYREQMHSDYQRALQTFDQDWLTESPVSRSLQKRKAMEQYLRRTDQLQASRQPCQEFVKPGEPRPVGPVILTLKNSEYPGRELKIFCEKKNVPVVALNNQGLGVMVRREPGRELASTLRRQASPSVTAGAR